MVGGGRVGYLEKKPYLVKWSIVYSDKRLSGLDLKKLVDS